MNEKNILRAFKLYGLQPAQLLSVQKGYRNRSYAAVLASSQQVNLILYKSEPDILGRIWRANAVANYTAAAGLPARRTIDDRIMKLRPAAGNAKGRTAYAALYAYLPGSTIPWEGYRQAHLKALGEMLSNLHATLQTFPKQPLDTSVAEEYLALLNRMHRYFTDPAVQRAMQSKLQLSLNMQAFSKLGHVLRACRTLPAQQPLHMDFVRGNILFDAQANITGILDFEKTAQGHPLFDIARTLAFLLVDCKYKSEVKIRKYFLLSGYNKRGGGQFKVTTHNEPLLNALVELFLLHDLYKFLRHNPYEFLHQNEHFVRTLAIMRRLEIAPLPAFQR